MAVAWDLNNGVLAANVGSTSMYLLKETMKTAGWKVNGSCDGSNFAASVAKPIGAGTADHIGSAAEFMTNQSWLVMEGPQGRQFLFGHKGTTSDTSWTIAYSVAAGYSGGNATTYPTAIDAVNVMGVAGTATTTATFLGNNSYVHLMASDSTDSFFCIPATVGTASVYGGLFCDILTQTVTGDLDTAVVGSFYSSGNEAFTASGIYSYRNCRGFFYNSGSSSYTFQEVSLATMNFGNFVVLPYSGQGLGLNPHDLHTDEVPALWCRDSSRGAPYGYKGISTLFRYCGGNIAPGDTLDSDGPYSRAVFGQYRTSVVWDGWTAPLV